MIDFYLPQVVLADPGAVSHVLLNWGANDMEQGAAAPANEANWTAQYASVLDYVHTRFPNARLYAAYPWRGGYDTEAARLHTWIDNAISTRSGFASGGMDEAVWMKNDAPASCDANCVHYTNPFGATLCASAWRTALGF